MSAARVNVSLSNAFPRVSPFAAGTTLLSRILRSTVKNDGSRLRYKGRVLSVDGPDEKHGGPTLQRVLNTPCVLKIERIVSINDRVWMTSSSSPL